MTSSLAEPQIAISSFVDGESLSSLADDVRHGLTRELKELPPKYLYDTRGSELFDRITTLPEYYPTRCERAILNRRSPEIVRITGAHELVEIGSGTASKTRALLHALAGAGALERYIPVDCAHSVVEQCCNELTELFPGLSVHGVIGDFERHLGHVPEGEDRIVALLGGTVGNFYPDERARFLSDLRQLMGDRGWLLLGTDLVKDVDVIETAYNDSEGVTAEFNRNVLRVINSELDANFDPEAFEHLAFFDAANSWVEMRLRAGSDQQVRIAGAGLDVAIAGGEEIRTEISAKFTLDALSRELRAAGMSIEAFFTDPAGMFGLTLAAPA